MRFIGIVLQPLVAFALFFAAAIIGRWVLNRTPPRVRAILGRPLYVFPRNEVERGDWRPVGALFIASALILGMLWFIDPLRH